MKPMELKMTKRMVEGIFMDITGERKKFETMTPTEIENTLVSQDFEDTGVYVDRDDFFRQCGI